MTRIDIHRMFFMHARVAILSSEDGDIAAVTQETDWRGRSLRDSVSKNETLIENSVE